MKLRYILRDKCPHCHKGNVFINTNLFSLKPGKMNHDCPVCNLNFTKEPGFYWGSMYVSYALMVAEIFATYIICRISGTAAFDSINLWFMIGAILVLSPFNFRIARLVWLYMFPR